MTAINDYIFNLVCIIILAGLCGVLIPEGRIGKYVNLVLGLLIITAILKPLFHMKNIDFNAVLPDYNISNTQNAAESYNMQVANSFAERIATEISGYISQTYGGQSTVKVTPLLNSNGNLEGIQEISIQTNTETQSQKLINDISGRYGVEKKNIKIRGAG